MSDEELIARLRDWPYQGETMANAAADRIENLTEHLAATRGHAKEAEAYAEELEKERDDYALKLMQAYNTYTEMHLDIERLSDKLATCEKYRDAYAGCDRIGTQAVRDLEAKLAKAVELLEAWGDVAVHCSIEEGVCCCGDNMENHTNPMDCGHTPLDHGTYIAIQLAEKTRATLAEIKGEIKGEKHD
jgi:phage shock protein A